MRWYATATHAQTEHPATLKVSQVHVTSVKLERKWNGGKILFGNNITQLPS